MAGGAQDGVEAEVEVGEDVAVENPFHVLAGVGQGLVGGAEEAQDGVEGEQHDCHEQHAHEHVQRQRVAEEVLCLFAVLLSEADADHRGSAYADHRAEGCTEVHQGEGDGEAGDGHRPHALPDEDAVHHVVQRGGRHGDDGRHGILHEELSYGRGAEGCGAVLGHKIRGNP